MAFKQFTSAHAALCSIVLLLSPGVLHVFAKDAGNTAKSPVKPHIVMILIDDWGHYDLGYRRPAGDKEILTPELDSLIASGLELTQAYSHFWCTPSRSSLLSGRLPMHVFQEQGVQFAMGTWNYDNPVHGGLGIVRNMTTLPHFMKQAGYDAHHVGKWDAGIATPRHSPIGRGFDSELLYFNHDNDHFHYNLTAPVMQLFFPQQCDNARYKASGFTDLWRDGAAWKDAPFGTYEDELFNRRAVEIVEQHNASKPLFLYYATHVAHAPLQAPQSYLDKFAFIDDVYRRRYHAMVNAIDDAVGNLTRALKAKGMWNNTLSDNGGPIYSCDGNPSLCGGANNHPMRGGKLSPLQGGIRVNAFLNGGILPPSRRGATESGMLHLADWLQTFCALAGVAPCTDAEAAAAGLPAIDSLDMWPLLSGANGTSPRTEIAMTSAGKEALVRADGMKLLTGSDIPFALWTGPTFPNVSTPNGGSGFNGLFEGVLNCASTPAGACLFNLTDDPNEHNDVADAHPDIVAEMKTALEAAIKDTFNPDRGSPDPKACEAWVANDGWYGPWVDVNGGGGARD